MGPMEDERGLEQGGVSSSDMYKIFGKEQLEAAQVSELGVPLRDIIISSIGQADETVLLSNNIFDLQHLLELSLDFSVDWLIEISTDFCTKNLASEDMVRPLLFA